MFFFAPGHEISNTAHELFVDKAVSYPGLNFLPGSNPTIGSNSGSVAIFYNTTSSLERFESKNILFLLYPTKNNARVVNLAVVGLAPGYICW
jgi:hypothetical protein